MIYKIVDNNGLKVGIGFLNSENGKGFKLEARSEISYTDNAVSKAFIKHKNEALYTTVPTHDSTRNFYKLLKRYAGKKDYLTPFEFAALVNKIGYDSFYYAYGLISAFEEIKPCKKSIRIKDSTNTVTYIRYNSKVKFYLENFMLIHKNKDNKNNVYKCMCY